MPSIAEHKRNDKIGGDGHWRAGRRYAFDSARRGDVNTDYNGGGEYRLACHYSDSILGGMARRRHGAAVSRRRHHRKSSIAENILLIENRGNRNPRTRRRSKVSYARCIQPSNQLLKSRHFVYNISQPK